MISVRAGLVLIVFTLLIWGARQLGHLARMEPILLEIVQLVGFFGVALIIVRCLPNKVG